MTDKTTNVEGTSVEEEDQSLTYGQKAVGLSFNPSGDPTVVKIKQLYAEIIDLVHELKDPVGLSDDGKKLYVDIVNDAHSLARSAQMMAVKAATWQA